MWGREPILINILFEVYLKANLEGILAVAESARERIPGLCSRETEAGKAERHAVSKKLCKKICHRKNSTETYKGQIWTISFRYRGAVPMPSGNPIAERRCFVFHQFFLPLCTVPCR